MLLQFYLKTLVNLLFPSPCMEKAVKIQVTPISPSPVHLPREVNRCLFTSLIYQNELVCGKISSIPQLCAGYLQAKVHGNVCLCDKYIIPLSRHPVRVFCFTGICRVIMSNQIPFCMFAWTTSLDVRKLRDALNSTLFQ